MFWRFGFSSTSTLDSLLDRPNVTLEEVLDEEELLQECKSQNQKLVQFLCQPRILSRLLEHVTGTAQVAGGSGKEWEEKVRFKYPYIASEVLSCEIWSIVEAVLDSDNLLEPFWNAVLSSRPLPNQPATPQHMHPLFKGLPWGPPLKPTENEVSEGADKSDDVAGEAASGPESTPTTTGVLGLQVADSSVSQASPSSGSCITTARENGPGRSVLAGYWAKVNGVFLDRKPKEMLNFIRSQPRITDRFVAHLETPAVVDLLYRIIQCEEAVPGAGVIDWLSSRELIPKLVDLLSPTHSTDLHNTVSELLKAIIALSAPSPAGLNQSQADPHGFGASSGAGGDSDSAFGQQQQQLGGVNNRLVRELASEPIVRKMVGYMLDDGLLPDQLHRRLSIAADEQALADLSTQDLDQEPSGEVPATGVRKRATEGARNSNLSALAEHPGSAGGNNSSDESAVGEEEDDDVEEVLRRRTPLTPAEAPAIVPTGALSPSGHDERHDSVATVRPSSFYSFPQVSAPTVPRTAETASSSLVTCIGILIELIRKNNSDYFEQHLFHTLRTHLLQRQQELAEVRARKRSEAKTAAKDASQRRALNESSESEVSASGAPAGTGDAGAEEKVLETADADASAEAALGQEEDNEDDDNEMEGMEEAMAELSEKLGIVHLGPMLCVLSERLPDFQELLKRGGSSVGVGGAAATTRVEEPGTLPTTHGTIQALTFERYRITELYAELLHCSNMALLNRKAGEGPQYSSDGVLQGGIDGLQTLARTLHGGDAAEEPTAAETAPAVLSADAPAVASETLPPPDETTAKGAEAKAPVSNDSAHADGMAGEPVPENNKLQAPSGKSEKASASRSHSREASTRHPAAGGSGSEDTDDEALLNEVSSVTAGEEEDPFADATQQGEEDDEDAKSIASALSGMSLADLTSPAPSGPPSPIDPSDFGSKPAKEYVVGDLLKLRFIQSDVIPTILSLFFDFPWNNFLHNVVYDILQQFFNGRMDVGLNRRLVLTVFQSGKLKERVVAGHRANEQSMSGPRKIRLGYMGHMLLIAEETVKLLERYPNEIARIIKPDAISESTEWTSFVNQTLKECRENQAAPLAGGRPQALNRAFQFGGGAGQGDGNIAVNANDTFANYLSAQMGAGSGAGEDDDDSDEDVNWLAHPSPDRPAADAPGFDDAFSGQNVSPISSDDDEWGPFSENSGVVGNASDFGFVGGAEPTSSASSYAPRQQPNLTPADWAADFQRTADDLGESRSSEDEEAAGDGSDSDAATPTTEVPPHAHGGLGGILDQPSGVDAVTTAHARRPSLEQKEAADAQLATATRRRAGSAASAGSSAGSEGAQQASSEQAPLGPGVDQEATRVNEEGLLERTLQDGSTVAVPLDEVALGTEQAVSDDTAES